MTSKVGRTTQLKRREMDFNLGVFRWIVLLVTLIGLAVHGESPTMSRHSPSHSPDVHSPTRTTDGDATREPKPSSDCQGSECSILTPDVISKRLETYETWLKDKGVILHEALNFPKPNEETGFLKYRSASLKRVVSVNDSLVIIPRNLALVVTDEVKVNYTTFIKSKVIKLLDKDDKPFARLRERELLLTLQVMMYLVQGESNPFHPYLQVLLASTDVIRMNSWTVTAFEDFQDNNVVAAVSENRRRIKDVANVLVDHKALKTMGVPLFLWSYSLVQHFSIDSTRSDDINAENDEVALIPGYDFFEVPHTMKATLSRGYDPKTFRVFPSPHFIQNDENEVPPLTLEFGPFSNFFFVTKYGFALIENLDDGYAMALRGFPDTDPLKPVKDEIWKSTMKGRSDVVTLFPRSIPSRLIAFFRILVVEHEDDLPDEVSYTPGYPEEEDMALLGCQRAIEEEIARLPTTLEDDEMELHNAGQRKVKDHLPEALRYRISRKRILAKNKCYCETMRQRHEKFVNDEDLDLEYYDDEYSKESVEVAVECQLRPAGTVSMDGYASDLAKEEQIIIS